MEIWGHRGASADAPENTLAAFELAVVQGADGIEFDVHRTADGELVVIHDETIDRTSDGTGVVAEMTLAELRRHRYTNGREGFADAGIPTLAEVLDWLPAGVQANVELKTLPTFYDGIAVAAADLIDRAGVADRVWVSSFNHHTLAQVADHAPHLRLGVLAVAHLWRPAAYVQACRAAAYHPAASALRTPEVVAECHAAGVRVHVWTLDDPEHIRQAEALGVDAVITNRPAAARVAVAAR